MDETEPNRRYTICTVYMYCWWLRSPGDKTGNGELDMATANQVITLIQ